MKPEFLTLLCFSFVFGAVIGSFLNVCIYRIPEGLSIVTPASRCPKCGTPIRWYHNIPIFSWLQLRGHCAYCGVAVPVRYMLVEALTATLFALFFFRFGLHPVTPVVLLLTATLIVVSFIDLDHQIIPNVISLPGIPIGFACSFLVPWVSWSDSLLGIVLGGGTLLVIALGYELLTGKEGMGFGDVKLLAMLGAFLGWSAVFPTIFIGSILGTLVGVPLMLLKKADGRLAIPFGPFLSAGVLVYLFFVQYFDPVMHWYLEAIKQIVRSIG
jgi:leader peptidase (prepilin peptidase)/N-methyltransferase